MGYKDRETKLKKLKEWRIKNADKIKAYNKNVRPLKKKELLTTRKLQGIELLGNKCSKCGYNKNYSALEFHHLNMDEKEYCISKLLQYGNVKQFFKEIRKCILLCANCHRELHYPDCNICHG